MRCAGRGGAARCGATAGLREVGRGRAQADEQHPPEDGGASQPRVEHHPARHAARQGGHHGDRSAAQAVRGQAEKAGGKLTVTADRAEDRGRRAQTFPQFNVVDRHREERDHLQEVDSHRRRRRHRTRAAGAGDPRRRSQRASSQLRRSWQRRPKRRVPGSCRSTRCRAAGSRSPTSAGSAGRAFTPIVNWPEVAILGMSRGAIEPVWQRPGVRAAADAAALALLRPPRDRRRRCRPLPALDRQALEQPFVMAL